MTFEQKYFCDFAASQALKEVGFKEECIATYSVTDTMSGKDDFDLHHSPIGIDDIGWQSILCPLHAQAVEWFFKRNESQTPVCFIERYNFITNLWTVEVTEYMFNDDGSERGYWTFKEVGAFSSELKHEAYNDAIKKACEVVKENMTAGFTHKR